MRKPNVRNKPRYETMIGATFKAVGRYLDACCSQNCNDDQECLVQRQCCRWWDRQCKITPPDLPSPRIAEVIQEFEEAREDWMGKLACIPPRDQPLVSRSHGITDSSSQRTANVMTA
jgi:hypothetical protein